jgi:hypothetical protein
VPESVGKGQGVLHMWKQRKGCLELETTLIWSIIVTMTEWCLGGGSF